MSRTLRVKVSDTCVYCGQTFAVDYATMRRLTPCPSHWQHERGQACADCGCAVHVTQEPWGDRAACVGCGAEAFRSIGD